MDVDFFFSFRSPYSYLAAPRAFALADEHEGVRVRYRGVIPMAMRGQAVPRAKRLHTLRDVAREAKRLGMPFGPIHDPIGSGAMRCLLVAQHAVDAGRERAFVLAASRGIWAEGKDVARDDVLAGICESVGLAWRDCERALHDPAMRARVDADTEELLGLGHWGVPVLRVGEELFWGQDRLVDVELALQDLGVARA